MRQLFVCSDGNKKDSRTMGAGVFTFVVLVALNNIGSMAATHLDSECEKTFFSNYGVFSDQQFANLSCTQHEITLSAEEPVLLMCQFFNLTVETQEFCMTVHWKDMGKIREGDGYDEQTKKKKNQKIIKKKKKRKEDSNLDKKEKKRGTKKKRGWETRKYRPGKLEKKRKKLEKVKKKLENLEEKKARLENLEETLNSPEKLEKNKRRLEKLETKIEKLEKKKNKLEKVKEKLEKLRKKKIKLESKMENLENPGKLEKKMKKMIKLEKKIEKLEKREDKLENNVEENEALEDIEPRKYKPRKLEKKNRYKLKKLIKRLEKLQRKKCRLENQEGKEDRLDKLLKRIEKLKMKKEKLENMIWGNETREGVETINYQPEKLEKNRKKMEKLYRNLEKLLEKKKKIENQEEKKVKQEKLLQKIEKLKKKREKLENENILERHRRMLNQGKGRIPPTPKPRLKKTGECKKKPKEEYVYGIKKYMKSYCGTDAPRGLNAFDGKIYLRIVPLGKVQENAFFNGSVTVMENSDSHGDTGNETTDGVDSDDDILPPGIRYSCTWSPSAT